MALTQILELDFVYFIQSRHVYFSHVLRVTQLQMGKFIFGTFPVTYHCNISVDETIPLKSFFLVIDFIS